MILKIIGTLLGLIGAILGVASSFFVFFPGNVVGLGDYNRPQDLMHHHDFWGSAIFILSITALILTLIAFKHHGLKGLFVILILLGVILLPLTAISAAGFMIVGGIIGLLGVWVHKSHTRGPSALL